MVAWVTIFPDAQQTLADAKENIQALEELSQGRPFRALADIRQMASQAREAREFYSEPSHTQRLVTVDENGDRKPADRQFLYGLQ
ncbi:MAG TPA: hypothetical protein VGD69_08740 [Herpetosiphonaceae bacterium]